MSETERPRLTDADLFAIKAIVKAAIEEARSAPTGMEPRPATRAGTPPTAFPNYGRSKGQPIAGATMGDLEYYANGARRSIADPTKAQWINKERALLAAIDAEIARQHGAPAAQQAMPAGAYDGSDIPFGAPPPDERPPPDDDTPF
jgi:hypothetical protein